jgi:methionine biosynthesis protein MetW
MLRVGMKAIISFPNWAHWQVRLQLLFKARAPVTRALPYQWHQNPNVRQLTVKDFLRFCGERDLCIGDRIYFSPAYRKVPAPAANWLASMAVFVIERPHARGLCGQSPSCAASSNRIQPPCSVQ